MTSYKRGDIVLVPFPFSNQSAAKKRPAVVISSTPYNDASPEYEGDVVSRMAILIIIRK